VYKRQVRGHIRNLDLQLGRLAEELARGRNELAREIKHELRIVARTVAATSGQPVLVKE
jgi:hypothetical protein